MWGRSRFPRCLAAKGWGAEGHHGGEAAPATDEEAQPDRPGEQAEDAQDPGGRRGGRRRRGPSLKGEGGEREALEQ